MYGIFFFLLLGTFKSFPVGFYSNYILKEWLKLPPDSKNKEYLQLYGHEFTKINIRHKHKKSQSIINTNTMEKGM